ncbi:hypothetical protein LR48_Vigan04g079200 [Vigna angularis]|uniref:Uncharacterized protein n=1 Tax=Phaseolus angularis TaxID=3914 RepID=A0A0L9UDJ0_PHAAN|nr:hypothetical protein LR48_Vigan04g079200 [Vigna angularis]
MADRRKLLTRRRSCPSTSADLRPHANLSGWISNMENHRKYYLDLIRVFYFNLKARDGVYSTRVKGVDTVMLTQGLGDFNKILAFHSFLKNPKGVDVSTRHSRALIQATRLTVLPSVKWDSSCKVIPTSIVTMWGTVRRLFRQVYRIASSNIKWVESLGNWCKLVGRASFFAARARSLGERPLLRPRWTSVLAGRRVSSRWASVYLLITGERSLDERSLLAGRAFSLGERASSRWASVHLQVSLDERPLLAGQASVSWASVRSSLGERPFVTGLTRSFQSLF